MSDNATNEQVSTAVASLGTDPEFVIVQSPARPGFAQAILRKRVYTVEHQDPSGEQWQALTGDASKVVAVLTGWVNERPGWLDGLTWTALGRF